MRGVGKTLRKMAGLESETTFIPANKTSGIFQGICWYDLFSFSFARKDIISRAPSPCLERRRKANKVCSILSFPRSIVISIRELKVRGIRELAKYIAEEGRSVQANLLERWRETFSLFLLSFCIYPNTVLSQEASSISRTFSTFRRFFFSFLCTFRLFSFFLSPFVPYVPGHRFSVWGETHHTRVPFKNVEDIRYVREGILFF